MVSLLGYILYDYILYVLLDCYTVYYSFCQLISIDRGGNTSNMFQYHATVLLNQQQQQAARK